MGPRGHRIFGFPVTFLVTSPPTRREGVAVALFAARQHRVRRGAGGRDLLGQGGLAAVAMVGVAMRAGAFDHARVRLSGKARDLPERNAAQRHPRRRRMRAGRQGPGREADALCRLEERPTERRLVQFECCSAEPNARIEISAAAGTWRRSDPAHRAFTVLLYRGTDLRQRFALVTPPL